MSNSMHGLVTTLWGNAIGKPDYDKSKWIQLDDMAIKVDKSGMFLPPLTKCSCVKKTREGTTYHSYTCEDCCGAGEVCSVCHQPRRNTALITPHIYGCDCKI